MSATSNPTANPFVWYDVMTNDMQATEAFYTKVVGWTAKDAGMPDGGYTIFSAGAATLAGQMPISAQARDMGVKPCWSGYIGVNDVDAYTQRVQAEGGAVHRPPEDIPGVGRFAVVADPQGAVFILFKGDGQPDQIPAAPGTPGTIGWHELYAKDGATAFAFYAKLFGWTKTEAMDMGAMGMYQMFATGGPTVGGMMTKPPEVPMPYWLYYFNVDAIDAAMARVTQYGGKVLMGPHEVPGGQWILQCTDPQGAMFALVAPKR
jgi:predicted enzyme related to lactoylglutathione lyase